MAEARHEARRSKKRVRVTGMARLRLIVIAVLVFMVLAGVFRLISYIGGISRVHLSDEGYKHAKRYEDCVKVKGIDVSVYQNEINWKKVKSSEADFAFIRAGYRKSDDGELFEDDRFRANMKGAERAGVMKGAYFFSQALTEAEAVEEADYLIKLVAPYDIDLPLVIDFETIEDGRLRKAIESGDFYAASQFHDIVLAFCRRVEEAGYESAVYANYDMLTNNMEAGLLDDEATIWAAQYGGSCDVKANYMFWQCSESAEADGIEGKVDQDFWYFEPGRVYATRAKGKKNAVSIGDCEIKLDADSYKLHGHRANPKVTVSYDGKKLRSGRHYEMGLVCNQVSGTGYAVIRGIGKYKDWTTVPFVIE